MSRTGHSLLKLLLLSLFLTACGGTDARVETRGEAPTPLPTESPIVIPTTAPRSPTPTAVTAEGDTANTDRAETDGDDTSSR